MAKVAKVIELVGESTQSWEDAVQSAVSEASRTVHGITGVEVTNWTAAVQNGKISEYKVDVKLAFGVDPNR
ncbi:MAG: dodecin family protein [Actinomycetia bacterium]|jgi:flavin-binding protein dodecin|nr:dodecin family protein [Actinomycetes bacterium]